MSRPEFSFLADSAEAGDESGIATWRHTIGSRVLTYHQHFNYFAEAHVLNELISHAYEAGLRDGSIHLGAVNES